MIYKEFKTWRKGAEYRLKMVFIGSLGFIYFTLICGAASLFAYCIRQINAFYRRETVAASIISLLILLLSAGWIFTFVKERHYRKEAEQKVDSLAYDLSKFTQMYDTTDIIVINGDTVRWNH